MSQLPGPQLKAMEIPLFEPLAEGEGQTSNYELWRAYEALRFEASVPNGAGRAAASAAKLRELRNKRSTWYGSEDGSIRRLVDAALDLWAKDAGQSVTRRIRVSFACIRGGTP